jgi:tetratricopeptide (TPR) repeat protein
MLLRTPADTEWQVLNAARRLSLRGVLFILVLGCGAVTASRSFAQDDGAARAGAAARFAEGTKAFDAKDYRRAAEAFEAAYRLSPLPDVLWNAARAWHLAGETAHAATLYERYLRDAPPDARDRPSATGFLGTLSPRLARMEIHGDAIGQLRIDGVPCEDRVVYVPRGAHVVSATVAGNPVRKSQQVDAGDDVSIVLDAADESPGGAATPASPHAAPAPEPSTSLVPDATPRRGWSPWVFVSGAVVAGVAVGFTIGSGIDTENALSTFNAHPTPGNLSSGQDKQLRTNVLLGASIGASALTAAAGIWLVDWHRGAQSIQVGVGPARGTLRWMF